MLASTTAARRDRGDDRRADRRRAPARQGGAPPADRLVQGAGSNLPDRAPLAGRARRRGHRDLGRATTPRRSRWRRALLGVHAVVVMPETAVRSKVEACRGYGAEVILEGADTSEAWAAMERIRDARGLTFLHPFDHLDTITGQGTVGLEIVEDLPEVDVVVAGIGGGGMACGVAAAVKGRRPGARVYGVEPVTSNALALGIAAGSPVPIRPLSVADGLNAPFASDTTIALGRRLLDDIVLLEDPEILAGLRFAAERMKQVLEPAGAAALAAVLLGRIPIRDGERVCVVLSGGKRRPGALRRAGRRGGSAARRRNRHPPPAAAALGRGGVQPGRPPLGRCRDRSMGRSRVATAG